MLSRKNAHCSLRPSNNRRHDETDLAPYRPLDTLGSWFERRFPGCRPVPPSHAADSCLGTRGRARQKAKCDDHGAAARLPLIRDWLGITSARTRAQPRGHRLTPSTLPTTISIGWRLNRNSTPPLAVLVVAARAGHVGFVATIRAATKPRPDARRSVAIHTRIPAPSTMTRWPRRLMSLSALRSERAHD